MPAPNAEDFFLFFYITGRRAPEPFLGPMFGLVQSCLDLWDTAHDKGALAASDPGGTTLFFKSYRHYGGLELAQGALLIA